MKYKTRKFDEGLGNWQSIEPKKIRTPLHDMCCYCMDKATHEVYNKQQIKPEYFCEKHAEGEAIRLNTHDN